MSKIIINCDEASLICNKNQYCEASLIDKIKLNFHIFLCKTCRLYSKQNVFVSKLCNKHLHKTTNAKLCVEDKEKLKLNLEKEISK